MKIFHLVLSLLLLNLALMPEAAGLYISNNCRAGFCGACKVTVKSGEVYQPDAPGIEDSDKAKGMALVCCAIPKTNVDIVR